MRSGAGAWARAGHAAPRRPSLRARRERQFRRQPPQAAQCHRRRRGQGRRGGGRCCWGAERILGALGGDSSIGLRQNGGRARRSQGRAWPQRATAVRRRRRRGAGVGRHQGRPCRQSGVRLLSACACRRRGGSVREAHLLLLWRMVHLDDTGTRLPGDHKPRHAAGGSARAAVAQDYRVALRLVHLLRCHSALMAKGFLREP
mmetsp:Transcript_146359/g.469544  ORF Transcript_146359/g.469544 Transcript_146359/m.469544 type:complete len:202 (-) Transcript_146359:55-660(-)